MANEKFRKKKQYRTLLSVLASGSTPEARRLLKDYCGEDAFSEADLESKLASLYATSTSKIDLEKDFANIHPHKDFILKYCQMESQPPINVNDLNTSNTKIVKQVDIITPPTKSEIENPTEGKACTCGCRRYSNAEGDAPNSSSATSPMILIGVVGIISILALTTTILFLRTEKL